MDPMARVVVVVPARAIDSGEGEAVGAGAAGDLE